MYKSLSSLLIAAGLTAGMLLTPSTDVVAQGRTRVGLKGGLNASSLFYNTQGVDTKKERIGFHTGVFAQAPLGEFFAIQPELLYTTKGSSANYSASILGSTFSGTNTFKLNYAELPVLATFKLGQSVELQAGPYVSYLLNSDLVTNTNFAGSGSDRISRDNFNKVDYGVAGGLNFFFGKALLGLRYEQGLQTIAKSGAAKTLLGNAKNGVGMISVGFSLN